MKKIFFLSLFLSTLLFSYDRITGLPFATRSEVIAENQKKLEARYGEQFEVQRSEVRKEGDL